MAVKGLEGGLGLGAGGEAGFGSWRGRGGGRNAVVSGISDGLSRVS